MNLDIIWEDLLLGEGDTSYFVIFLRGVCLGGHWDSYFRLFFFCLFFVPNYYGGESCKNSKLLEKIRNQLSCTLSHLTRVIYLIWIYGKSLYI